MSPKNRERLKLVYYVILITEISAGIALTTAADGKYVKCMG